MKLMKQLNEANETTKFNTNTMKQKKKKSFNLNGTKETATFDTKENEIIQ